MCNIQIIGVIFFVKGKILQKRFDVLWSALAYRSCPPDVVNVCLIQMIAKQITFLKSFEFCIILWNPIRVIQPLTLHHVSHLPTRSWYNTSLILIMYDLFKLLRHMIMYSEFLTLLPLQPDP